MSITCQINQKISEVHRIVKKITFEGTFEGTIYDINLMSLNTVKIPPSPFVMIKPEFPLWLFPHAWPVPNEILIYHMIWKVRYYLSFFYCILRRSTQQDRPLRAPVIKIGSYDPSWGLDIKFSTSKSRASFKSHKQRHCPKRKDVLIIENFWTYTSKAKLLPQNLFMGHTLLRYH